MTNTEMELIVERVEEIQDIMRMATRENRWDIVDQMIDELDEINERLEYKGYLC